MDLETDGITELVEIDAEDGVHGVGSPANGMKFVLIKSIEPVMKCTVCDDPECDGCEDDEDDEEFMKAKYSMADKKAMMSQGHAIANDKGNPSYPIKDEEDLAKAIKAVGRGGADHDAIRKHIIKRAKALGKSDMIPENWNGNGSLKKVKKAEDYINGDPDSMPDTSMAPGSDANGGLTSPDNPSGMMMMDDGGNPDLIPGSPSWEGKDADTLIEAGQHLAEASKIVNFSIAREQAEVNAGHANDEDDVWTLQEALMMIQHALHGVAATAFNEEAEANVVKSLTEESVSEMSQTINLLQKMVDQAGVQTPTGAENTDFRKEMLHMDLTPEQLADLVSKSVDAALDARIPKAPTPPTPEEVAAAREILAKAEGDMTESNNPAMGVVSEVTQVMGTSTPNMAGIPSELTDVLKSAIEQAVAPIAEKNAELETQLAKALGAPAPGGPVLSSQSIPTEGPRGGIDKTPFEALKSDIVKAEASGNVSKGAELRRKLGQDILRAAFAGRGYEDTGARPYTAPNAAL